ncbi:Nuclear receptor subfamily 2 group E member 1 [Bagarius yarrelli]|uniref:Nuclear receptor subfamily 2 group E member 1 n=1 Tax=Bagarius yarrelli TaxID=175774 RepID=A0A556TZK6_BAGYA|nr:Nuclear receptor subfamily 2 group E member 1 [Bagarius yarrelli]
MGLPMERTRVKPSQISQPRDQLIRPLSGPSHCQHINTFTAHCPDPPAAGFSPSNSQFCPRQLRRKFLTDNLPQIDLSESVHQPAGESGFKVPTDAEHPPVYAAKNSGDSELGHQSKHKTDPKSGFEFLLKREKRFRNEKLNKVGFLISRVKCVETEVQENITEFTHVMDAPDSSKGAYGGTGPAVQHERGPRTSTIRKQVALYFRGHKEVNGSSTHFPSTSIPGLHFFTTVTQLETHSLELNTVPSTPERQGIVGLAQPTPKYPHEVSGTPMYLYEVATESVCESAARLLFMSIKWAKSVPAFSTLPLQDQLILLEDAWRELFVLGVAQWSIPVDSNTLLAVSGMTTENTESQRLNKVVSEIQALQEVVTRFRQLRLDATEFACLKCIVTFKAVPTPSGAEVRSFRNATGIAALQDEAQLTLNSYIHTRYPTQPCRFGKLLLLLPALRSVSASTIEEVFFRKTIGNVPITRLLSDMYKSSDI